MADSVAQLREFNRVFTRRLGLLNDRLDGSRFTLCEARLLYELAHRDNLRAADLSRELDLDPGQVSRLVNRLAARGLVRRTPSDIHAKHRLLTLTGEGRREFEALDRLTREAVGNLLSSVGAPDRAALLRSLASATRILRGKGEAARPSLRPLKVGDLGWITHRQAILYAEEYGWDWTYEALVSRILGEFAAEFDPARDAAWVAEDRGMVLGSIFLVRGATPGIARLRLLYVEPDARGLGLGSLLVETCIARARELGYTQLELWTNDVLVSARRIYRAAGFRLVDEKPHHSFGRDLIGQTWSMAL